MQTAKLKKQSVSDLGIRNEGVHEPCCMLYKLSFVSLSKDERANSATISLSAAIQLQL